MGILYLVIPCYNEEAVIEHTVEELTPLLADLERKSKIAPESRILLVDDGSKDTTWEKIETLHRENPFVCGLKLAHNRGHQNALMAGLMEARKYCDCAVSMDADLQDDIHILEAFIDKFNAGTDIVYGVRNKRETDTFFKRTTALGFYKVMHLLGVETVYNHADYRLMSCRAIQQLCRFRERNLYLRGLVPLIGYQTACVYYNRDKRFAGESKYPFKKMLNFAIDGITSFSVKPVRMVFWLGCIFILIAVCVTIWTLRAYYFHDTVPGWSSLMISLWLVGGTILVSLGIVGEYIGKIYIEVKNRPRYNEEELLLR